VSTDPCDACGTEVKIAGGIADFWSFAEDTTGGMSLELADGSDFFLCFDCIERLPDDRAVTREDVEALAE
jgi:hypothetical protein